MIIVWTLLALFFILLLICIFRAARAKTLSDIPFTVTKEQKERSKEYANGLVRLIQKETISSVHNKDMTKFYEFQQLLETEFPNLHRVCEKHDFNGSLLFKWSGTTNGSEPILLMNHLDVVEANPANWSAAPFSGTIIDGKIYGRGAADDKGPLYVMLQSVEELIASGYAPPCDVYLTSSCTEEIAGEGAPAIAKWFSERHIKFRFLLDEGGMIVNEPIKGIRGTYAMVGIVEKAQGNVKFTAKSTGGHASAPGFNTPLVRLGKFMTDIEKNYPFRVEITDYFSEMLRRLAPSLPFGVRIVTENLWLFKPFLKIIVKKAPMLAAMTRTTIAFTTASGSSGYNVLPQEAFVTANIRYAPHQGAEETHRILNKLADKYHLEMEVLNAGTPIPVVDYKKEAFALIEKTIHEIYPSVQISPYIMTGGTDAQFYSALTDDGIRFAPLYITADQISRVHGIDENIDIDTLASGVDFYKRLIQNL